MDEAAERVSVGSLYAIVLDVNDLEICGRFWSRMLGVDVLYEDQRYMRLGHAGTRPTLLLQKVPEGHEGKNRVHIDLDVPDLDVAARRAEALGAQPVRTVNEYGLAWAVMRDPDGNEFCLVQHA
jgi:predicted enzyme related to lactoylglutathione lyase